jgi:IMP dehydrogenase/GMP reductase
LTPAQQQEIEYKDVGDKFVPVYKYNGQPVPGMQPIAKNLTPGDQQRAQEVEYKDVGDKFVPVNKITGQPVEGMQPIAKNLTPGDQQRAQEVDYKDAGDKFVPVYKMSGQPVEGAKPIPKGVSAYQEAQLRNENERIAQEKSRIDLERRRVVVAEEQQRLAKDPDFQRRMAEARKTGEDIAKGNVAAQQALPKIVTRAEEGLRLIDEMIGKRDDTGKLLPGQKVHPGFGNAVGFGLPFRFIPGTSESDFQARFDQIKGASFLEAFESLKGGGAITEKEGEKATGAINRMGLAQSEREFIAAARDLQEVVRKGVANAQRRAAAGAAGTGASPSPAASSGTPPPPPGFRRD